MTARHLVPRDGSERKAHLFSVVISIKVLVALGKCLCFLRPTLDMDFKNLELWMGSDSLDSLSTANGTDARFSGTSYP